MSDQFPPAPPPPPPPPPPQQPYQQPQQPQYAYAQQAPAVKTGMSGGLKALLIIGGILAGLGVLTIGGLIVVGAFVANEAEQIVNTAASDLDEDLDELEEDENPFASDDEDEDTDVGSSFDDEEADLGTWCGTVDEFDAFTRASTEGTSPAEVEEKIVVVDEMITIVRDTAPTDLSADVDEVLVPYEATVAFMESVDFDTSQLSAEDQQELNELFRDALPSMLAVQQACSPEGFSVFESDD